MRHRYVSLVYQSQSHEWGASAIFFLQVARRCTICVSERLWFLVSSSLSADQQKVSLSPLDCISPLTMNIPRQTTSPINRHSHIWCHGRLTSSQAALPLRNTSPAPSHHNYPLNRRESHQHCPRRRQNRSSTAETASANASTSAKSSTRELVDDLLQRIGNSDSGVGLQQEEEGAVNDIIEQLEEVGQQQVPRPLDNPLIFGDFYVAFSSTQRTSQQNTQPAGGNFRSKPGRLIFQTKELCQSIFKPDFATNKVGFAILGFISGSVGLRGKFVPQGDNKDTVKVSFEPPRVSLPGGISLAVGPTSSVVLSTTYLDERVRLGRGGRGSSFVFTRGGVCGNAGMEDIGLAKTSTSGYAILLSLIAAFSAAAYLLFTSGPILSKVLAVAPALLGAALVFALVRNLQYDE